MTSDRKLPATSYPSLSVPVPVRRLVGAHLVVALVALGVGGIFGVLQALSTGGVQLYGLVNRALPAPVQVNYYEGLTIHGVMMALVFTTFFICGLLAFVTARSVGADHLRLRLE
jgi:cytochrome c oxidase subunit 1